MASLIRLSLSPMYDSYPIRAEVHPHRQVHAHAWRTCEDHSYIPYIIFRVYNTLEHKLVILRAYSVRPTQSPHKPERKQSM